MCFLKKRRDFLHVGIGGLDDIGKGSCTLKKTELSISKDVNLTELKGSFFERELEGGGV